MEDQTQSSQESQEPKKNRTGLIIVLLLLLAFLVICCVGTALLCNFSAGLPGVMEQIYDILEEQGIDPDAYIEPGGDWEPEFPDQEDDFQAEEDVEPTLDISGQLTGGNCPVQETAFNLEVSHSWDFSPNRDWDLMRVDGVIEPPYACPLTVQGNQVTIAPCQVPFTCSGYMQTDAGECDIQASGFAELTFEDASCSQGMVTMTIVETLDVDADYSGTMECPGVSEPYIPFYPFSRTEVTFAIDPQGSVQEADADPDMSNQFSYQKEWKLIPAE